MESNLELSYELKFCQVSCNDENCINISLNFIDFDDLSLFIIIFSYLKFRFFIIEKIILVFEEPDGYFYRNISFIQNFTYIDFKIWWNKLKNNNYSVSDTKLYTGSDVSLVSISIYLEKNSFSHSLNKFKKLDFLQPKAPLKNRRILQEIVGNLGDDIIEAFSETEK